jgi:TusA-related sulfurtransferase
MERIDLRGLECPVPTLKAVEAVKDAATRGQALTVLVDDAVCAEEIPTQVGRWRYRAAVRRSADSEWTIQLDPMKPPGDPG